MIETLFALSAIGLGFFAFGVFGFFCAIYSFKEHQGLSFFWTLACLAGFAFAFQTQLLGFGANFTTSMPVPGGPPDTVINWGAVWLFALKALGYWLVGAAITSVLFWFSFVRDIKKRFEARLQPILNRMKNESRFAGWSARAKSSVAKAAAIGNCRDNIFLVRDYQLSIDRDITGRIEGIGLLDVIWEPKPVVLAAFEKLGDLTRKPSEAIAEEQQAVAEYEALTIAETNLTALEQAVGEVLPPRAGNFKSYIDITYAATVWPITLVSLLITDFLRHVVDLAFTYFRGFLDSVSKMAFGEFSAK